MNWDQIETKWAAMTRRVRADWAIERPDMSVKGSRGTSRGEMTRAVLAERTSSASESARHKIAQE